eukprot:comp11336_c0_seq1/m.5733 comp11336_c0_seq1/g.5733  ORF comp11336_c0_seq1/g.5733 comp11336_c0_seq1/m.5733 type:complete len:298 (-) comp11336_c0_seq1:201-1094(-)
MPFTYHSHCGQYCKHASGTLEEVVTRARAIGFISLGLSEHMPRFRDQDLYPEEREANMSPADLQQVFSDYVTEAKMHQSQGGSMEIVVGMETEFLGDTPVEDCLRLMGQHSLDYAVGSVHHVQGIPIDFSDDLYCRAEEALGGTEAVFLGYFDHQYELIKGLKPAVIGHFDVIRMFRPNHPLSPEAWQKIHRNIKCAIEYGALFEVNSRAYKKKLSGCYPLPDIFQVMISKGARFVLTDDSHGPNDLAMFYARARDYLLEYGVTTIYRLLKDVSGKVTPREVPDFHKLPFWDNIEKI